GPTGKSPVLSAKLPHLASLGLLMHLVEAGQRFVLLDQLEDGGGVSGLGKFSLNAGQAEPGLVHVRVTVGGVIGANSLSQRLQFIHIHALPPRPARTTNSSVAQAPMAMSQVSAMIGVVIANLPSSSAQTCASGARWSGAR